MVRWVVSMLCLLFTYDLHQDSRHYSPWLAGVGVGRVVEHKVVERKVVEVSMVVGRAVGRVDGEDEVCWERGGRRKLSKDYNHHYHHHKEVGVVVVEGEVGVEAVVVVVVGVMIEHKDCSLVSKKEAPSKGLWQGYCHV